MYLAYADESGDSGYDKSPSSAFVLSILLVHERDWLRLLDRLVTMRRYINSTYGVSPRVELKASYLIQRQGIFRRLPLGPTERLSIYELAMKFQRVEAAFTSFAIFIDKTKIQNRDRDPREFAWGFAIERLDNFAAHKGEFVHLLPDAGHSYFIRRLVRRMRRYHHVPSAFDQTSLSAAAVRVVEDPSERHSEESYFIQLADLNAYAALRHVVPTKRLGGELWDELGDTRLSEVNRIAGGPVGIKVFPT